MATSAKISEKTKRITEVLSTETGLKQIDLLEKAVVHYWHDWRIASINASFAALNDDPKALAKWKKESAELEGTIADGLSND
jgi:hypothetical protein